MDKPQDNNGRCTEHKAGCGVDVNDGCLCKVDARECQLIKGMVWQVSVRRIDSKGIVQCKIGVTRVLWYDLKLVGNRIVVIANRNKFPDGQKKLPSTTHVNTYCGGCAELVFIDGGNVVKNDS